jgi:hypothetical protein
MTSSAVLAVLGVLPSSAEATHHGQSGADAAPLPREAPMPSPPPRKIADLQADIEPRQLSTSLAFDAEPRATDAMLRA